MLKEFFCRGGKRAVCEAWLGLLVFVAHAFFKAWLKHALNKWYNEFYDEVQTAMPAAETFETGSGPDDLLDALLKRRKTINELLTRFCIIVAPSILVHPLAKYCAQRWTYAWRVALLRSYLTAWDPVGPAVEGAAQRLHEDTQRFSDGVFSCFATLLNSVLTLAVFSPILIELGDRVAPPVHGWGRDWLFAIAVSGALGGILTSALVGRKLVGLEVANQKIEARLRTKLVLLAERPDEAPPPPVSNSFQMVLKDMWQNYHRLFTEFVWMNTWLSTFDQAWVIIPYVLCAPLLFADDPSRRISLGTLVATSNAFGKVFDSLAVLSDAWPAVNAFRSVVRRLREFEAKVYENKSAARLARVAATVSSGTCSATRHMELAEVDADLVDPGYDSHDRAGTLPEDATRRV